jgi:hypothetical protein
MKSIPTAKLSVWLAPTFLPAIHPTQKNGIYHVHLRSEALAPLHKQCASAGVAVPRVLKSARTKCLEPHAI